MKQIATLFDVIHELKNKPRTGWVDHKVTTPETVWEHSASMRTVARTLAARYLGPTQIDKCGKLAAVHDIIEGIVPDITPAMGITPEQKHELEMIAINHIGTMSKGGAKIRDLWLEFENKETEAARFVNKIDKMHVTLLALRYEQQNCCPYSLQTFWDYAEKHVTGSPLKQVFDDLQAQRPKDAQSKPVLERRPLPPGSFDLLKKQVLAKIGQNPAP